jgi:predicted DNA-binding transcriptional regulator AlpA
MSTSPQELRRLLNPREAAAVTGLSTSTLAKRRCLRSDGPRFVRLGRAIRYDPGDLAEFVGRNKHDSTSGYAAQASGRSAAP